MANFKKTVFKSKAKLCLFVLVMLLLSIFSAADSYSAGCVQPPSGMVSWWGGDNNALDMVGSNDGTLMGGATFASGMVGQAFSFDGVDDYIELPAGFADFTSGFTVSLWANPTASGSWARFIDLGNGQANDNILFDRRTTSNDLTLEVYNEFGSTTGMAYSVDAITNNEWHHYAATLDAFGKVKMFKDGLPLVMAADTTGVPNNVTRVSNYIAKSNWSYDAFYAGSIDEVQIFNRVLDAAEIAAIYNAGSAGECRSCAQPPSGMIAWWGGDNNALDMVGTNNGTMMNGATYAAGMVGQAFSFDGTNQYVEAPDSPSLRIPTAITLDAWINTADPSRGQAIIWKSQNVGNWASYFFTIGGGKMGFEIDNWSTGTYGGWLADFNPSANTWYHVAVTWQNVYGDGRDATIYINGVPQTTQLVYNQGYNSSFTLYYTSLPLYIGQDEVRSRAFNGLIDEVEIFDRVLTTDEIAAIYNAGSTGKCIPYSVTATAGAGGSLDATTPSPATVNTGATATFIFNANTGYHVATITDTCGGAGYANTSNAVNTCTYTTPAITGNCGVIATFAINAYTVTPSAGANGSISPNTQQTVDDGNTIEFTAAPDNGYSASVGGSCGGTLVGNVYTTDPITANCTVVANFNLVKPMPDLVVSSLYGPSSGVAGGMITVTVTIKNQGTAPLSTNKLLPVTAKLYMSADTTITTGDISIGQILVPSLAPGGSSTATVSVRLPSTMTQGNYYIGAVVDPKNIVAEHKENNNVGYSATPISIKAAEPMPKPW